MSQLKLKNFSEVSEEVANRAKTEFTLTRTQSPFQHGVTFQVTGFAFRKPVYDDIKASENATPIPVLTTTVGDLFIKMLFRKGIDAEGNIIDHDGSFNKEVSDILATNSTKNDGEILSLIVENCKDKKLVVSRKNFVGINTLNQRYATSIVDINYVD